MNEKILILKPFKKDSYDFRIEVKVINLDNNKLRLIYTVLGDMSELELPVHQELQENRKRVIGLWEKTCFEIFLKETKKKNYYEFNFSPDGNWNCFFFEKPGDYLIPYPLKEIPQINLLTSDLKKGHYKLEVDLDLNKILASFLIKDHIDIGISAVIKKNGQATHWAISHHDKHPNFHNFKSFIRLKLEDKFLN